MFGALLDVLVIDENCYRRAVAVLSPHIASNVWKIQDNCVVDCVL